MDTGETKSPHIELIEPDTDIYPISYTEAPHIELIEPETDINPTYSGAETLPELVELQDTPTIDLEKDTGIEKEYGTLD